VNLRAQLLFWSGALLFLLLFLWVFSDILLPFILGMALAYLLDPIADWLERAGMSRFWATITIVVLTVLVLALNTALNDRPTVGFPLKSPDCQSPSSTLPKPTSVGSSTDRSGEAFAVVWKSSRTLKKLPPSGVIAAPA